VERPVSQESLRGQLVPELDTSSGVVLNKSQYDAFFGTPLEQILSTKSIHQVVILRCHDTFYVVKQLPGRLLCVASKFSLP